MALPKKLLLLALANILQKNNHCSKALGELSSVCTILELARSRSNEILESSVCTILELARSRSNEILEINILQKFSSRVLCWGLPTSVPNSF